jgi:hypothetical protein
MRELFQGDLNTKLNCNIISNDFQELPCNCRLPGTPLQLQEQEYVPIQRQVSQLDHGVPNNMSPNEQALHRQHPIAHENKNARPHPRHQEALH